MIIIGSLRRVGLGLKLVITCSVWPLPVTTDNRDTWYIAICGIRVCTVIFLTMYLMAIMQVNGLQTRSFDLFTSYKNSENMAKWKWHPSSGRMSQNRWRMFRHQINVGISGEFVVIDY